MIVGALMWSWSSLAMGNKDRRIINEIEHGKKIVGNAREVWNWESPAGK